jgi:predicted Rossmann fold flavoprotein
MQQMLSVVVVGGGAAGLMAAGRAAEMGAQVTLLEKTARVGTKLALTGHGRGNLAHAGDTTDFVEHLIPDGAFMRNALARFSTARLLDHLNTLGLDTVTEADGRVYPATHRATDIVATLRRYCLAGGVRIRASTPVAALLVSDRTTHGVRLGDGLSMEADAVVLATGGKSYPQTGSTGDGYAMARAAGHTVRPPAPGLVPLVLEERSVSKLQGVSLRDVSATLWRAQEIVARRRGELLFTHFGVSGPVILSLSLMASEALQRGPLQLTLDLAPDLAASSFEEQVRSMAASRPHGHGRGFLRGYVPEALADYLLAQSTIPRERELGQLSNKERQELYNAVKNMRLTVVRTRPITEAMVTVGGICTQEIDPRTMASRVLQGLYLAGEIIDVAGDTGGYNLQIAFTTGYLAGESAARAVPRSKA